MTVGPRTVAVSFPASPEFQAALADVLGGAATLAFLAGQEDEDRRASLGTADALMCWNLERELTGPELAGARAVRFVQLLSAGADHVPFERIPDWVVVASGPAIGGTPPPPLGRRVFAHHHVPCFSCQRCRAGRHTLCDGFRRNGLRPGGFSERFLVTAEHAAADLLEIPSHLSDDVATLVEPLACCIRGQRQAGVGPATRLLILGLGQTGLLLLWISAILTIYTGWDYLHAGIHHLLEEDGK